MSVDGFIADEAGGVEWLNPYFSSEMDFAGFMAGVGSVIGRTTYDDGAAASGPSFGKSVILTHRPLVGAPEGVETWGGDLAELVARLPVLLG